MGPKVTFRIVRFVMAEGPARYIGMAWNYDAAIMLATSDYATYTEARAALDGLAEGRGVNLAWFDGEYERRPGSDQMFPFTS